MGSINAGSGTSSGTHNERQVSYYSAFIKKGMIPRNTPYIIRHVEEMFSFAGLGEGDRVLEVGCGMGRYSFLLTEKGIRLEGLDLTPFLLEMFETYNGKRYDIPLHCCDIKDAPDKLHGTFDAVVGFFTLHHMNELDTVMQAVHRLLRPGGTMAFLEPNAFNPLYYAQVLLTPGMTWSGDKGIVNMRAGVVAPAVRNAGFKNYETRKFGFFPPFLTNKSLGGRLEALLEKLPPLYPFLPFQIFKAVK
jgi:SAM-dependent methyltransferase